MKVKIDDISKVFGIPYSVIMELMQKSDIIFEETQQISETELKKFRPILMQYYQQHHTENEAERKCEKSCNDFLEQLIRDHVIMMDTCSIMHEKCDVLLDAIVPILKKYHKKIVIPNKVIEELRKHMQCFKDFYKAELAKKGLELCKYLQNENCLTIRGSETDNFADNVFFVHFLDLRFKHHMVLITQDYNLGHDILQLNNMKTVVGNSVEVFKISQKGTLVEIME